MWDDRVHSIGIAVRYWRLAKVFKSRRGIFRSSTVRPSRNSVSLLSARAISLSASLVIAPPRHAPAPLGDRHLFAGQLGRERFRKVVGHHAQ
jgi:hypothetical protein